jgi:predicted enzyme related to lactoylglutathione lyase
VFGAGLARVLDAGRPLLLAAQQSDEIRIDLTLEQILDMWLQPSPTPRRIVPCVSSRSRRASYARAPVEILTSRVLLQPTDLSRSLRFYAHTIELAIYRSWGNGPSRGVVFFLGGGGLLEISGASAHAPCGAIKLVLQVRDISETRDRLAERGVALDAAPELKPWGLLEMTARDPDGVALIFVEVPPEHPRRRG